jgi:Amt family ammonium transporter
MLTSSLLVLLMCLPGLALFYGGLVRAKNVLSIFVQCFAMAGVMSLLWVAFGYALAAGGNGNAYFGWDSSFLFLKHIQESTMMDGGTIPESVWVMFQMTFVIISPAIIVGAFAERMKFSAILIFTVIWTILSYLPMWHMVWGEGFCIIGGRLILLVVMWCISMPESLGWSLVYLSESVRGSPDQHWFLTMCRMC